MNLQTTKAIKLTNRTKASFQTNFFLGYESLDDKDNKSEDEPSKSVLQKLNILTRMLALEWSFPTRPQKKNSLNTIKHNIVTVTIYILYVSEVDNIQKKR